MREDTAVTPADFFEDLKSRAQTAAEAGQLEEAGRIMREALDWAKTHGDPNQIDSAVCASAAVKIQLGQGEPELPVLREILLRSGDPANCRLAAYHISLYYDLKKNFKKSLFYARIARDRAAVHGRADFLALSHNQIGNALLGESFVEEASQSYEQALELMARRGNHWLAIVQANLGYCRILQRRFTDGYRLLYRAIRSLRQLHQPRYEAIARLDLCFAHLETGRFQQARRHGEIALRFGEQSGDVDTMKNALYLLGETAGLSGDRGAAHAHFVRLQKEFFPDASYLPAFLLTVDVRKMINLHA
jgi:tetratricopeptide (TPR) repeat protein